MSIPAGYEGFAALGDLVTGGVGQRAHGEFYKGVRESASAFKALEEARQERARSMAREALPEAVRSAGIAHPELASALLGMATGQPNLSTVTNGLQDLGEMELARQQEEALRNGNVKLANQLRAVRADKDYEPVREVAGNLIPSGTTLGDPDFKVQPLPQTQARIAVSDAQRQKALRPPAAHAHAPKPAGTGPTEAEVLADARAKIAAGVPIDAIRKRLVDRGYRKLANKL